MSRSLSREFALQLLYQLDTYPEDEEEQIESFLIERLGAEPTEAYTQRQRRYQRKEETMNPVERAATKAPRVYRRAVKNREDLDETLPVQQEYTPSWDPYVPISDDKSKQARINEDDLQFVKGLAGSVHAERPQLDLLYAPFLKAWTPSRLPRIDRCILRLAAYEIYYSDDMPVAAAINEAVELAKRFASDNAPSYINAVLGRMVEEQPVPPQDEEQPVLHAAEEQPSAPQSEEEQPVLTQEDQQPLPSENEEQSFDAENQNETSAE